MQIVNQLLALALSAKAIQLSIDAVVEPVSPAATNCLNGCTPGTFMDPATNNMCMSFDCGSDCQFDYVLEECVESCGASTYWNAAEKTCKTTEDDVP